MTQNLILVLLDVLVFYESHFLLENFLILDIKEFQSRRSIAKIDFPEPISAQDFNLSLASHLPLTFYIYLIAELQLVLLLEDQVHHKPIGWQM